MRIKKNRIAILASGLFCISAIVACVGGPGPLPTGNDENPDIEKVGTGKSGSGSGSSQGGSTGSSTGSGTSNPGTTTPSQPPPVSNTKSISASEFSRSCSVDADCVAIFQGSVCTTCQCPSGAIAKTDETSYQTALATRRSDPPCGPQPDIACPECSTTLSAVCSSNKQCSLGIPKKDGG